MFILYFSPTSIANFRNREHLSSRIRLNVNIFFCCVVMSIPWKTLTTFLRITSATSDQGMMIYFLSNKFLVSSVYLYFSSDGMLAHLLMKQKNSDVQMILPQYVPRTMMHWASKSATLGLNYLSHSMICLIFWACRDASAADGCGTNFKGFLLFKTRCNKLLLSIF